MRHLRFDKIARMEMKEGGTYLVPSSDSAEVNCVRVKAGVLSFGWANLKEEFYQARNKARFWKIPSGTKKCCFPDFVRNNGGFCYGEIKLL